MSYYYIDYENTGYNGFEGLDSLHSRDKVFVFCRKDQKKLIKNYLLRYSKRKLISYVLVKGNCPDALDFQLITSLTLKIRKNSVYYIISYDTGYDVAIDFLKSEGYMVFRMHTLESGVEPITLNKKKYGRFK